MKTTHAPQLLIDLLALPTAPMNEGYVVAYIRQWAEQRAGLVFRQDAFGNVLLEWNHCGKAGKRGSKSPRLQKTRTKSPPLVLAAHMDHPGFEAGRKIKPRRIRAAWHGWVKPEYFLGTKVRFFSDGRWIGGVIRATQEGIVREWRRVVTAEIDVQADVRPGSIGMWDLPDPAVRGDKLYARGCDDVGGVAAVLLALDQICRQRRPVHVMALLTRAEEVGFGGAIAACRAGSIPRDARIVAVETSSEIPGVRMGDGAILRVGDSSAIFSPGLTGFCRLVASDLAKADPSFKYQRKLMDGGTCESTVYWAEGYDATGLCIALGNYHNMDTRRERIASEYIHLDDFEGLVKWFVALATTRRSYDAYCGKLATMIAAREREHLPRLKRTLGRVCP